MGVRELIPFMMLQLDRDQECYDFIKWYETSDPDGTYDWGDMDLPFLDVKNADPIEDVEFMNLEPGSLNNRVAVMLLKFKILLDCIMIRLAQRVLVGKLPIELLQTIQRHILRSPLSVKFQLASKNNG